MGKSKKQLADEAYRRNEERLAGRVPVPPGVLPGQIDMLTGEIAGSTERVDLGIDYAGGRSDDYTAVAEVVVCDDVPARCSRCNRLMTVAYGWACLKPREDRKLMCGNCALVIVVPQRAYDTLADAVRAHYEAIDRPAPKPEAARGRRTRGAG